MRLALALGLIGLAAIATFAPAADEPPSAEDAKLAAFFKGFLDAQFAAQPVMATQLGSRATAGSTTRSCRTTSNANSGSTSISSRSRTTRARITPTSSM